jgi:hypothetical protein
MLICACRRDISEEALVSDQGPMPEGQPYPQPYPAPGYSQPDGQQPYAPQPYAPQAYPTQYPTYAYGYAAPARPTNTMAVVALVAGLVGLFVIPFIGSIVAVVTGHMSRKQIRETGENGDGMAVAGLVTGWIGVGIWLAVIVFAIVLPLIIVGAAATSTAG